MLTIEVAFDDPAASAALARLQSRLGDGEGLHEAMAERVDTTVRDHIRTVKGPASPNTDWWGNAADSVVHTSTATEGTVRVTQIGAALRFHGGRVSQKPDGPLLTLPSKHVPIQNKTRLAARALTLAFIPARKGATVGVLVEGEETGKTVKGGKRAGMPATRPKAGGHLMFVLRTETDHKPDPSVLPTNAELAESARQAAHDFVRADL